MACVPHFTISNIMVSRPSLGFARGVELEIAVARQAEVLGHVVIKEPEDLQKNEHGFDVISFDPVTGKLHIWEAKSGNRVTMNDLTSFKNAWNEPTKDQIRNKTNQGDLASAKIYAGERKNALFGDRLKTGLLAQFPQGSLARETVQQCINEGRLEYHLIGEVDTKFSRDIQKKATS